MEDQQIDYEPSLRKNASTGHHAISRANKENMGKDFCLNNNQYQNLAQNGSGMNSCRGANQWTTTADSFGEASRPQRRNSFAGKSRREMFEQQRANFRRKSREMRKSVERTCVGNEVAQKLISAAPKPPTISISSHLNMGMTNSKIDLSKLQENNVPPMPINPVVPVKATSTTIYKSPTKLQNDSSEESKCSNPDKDAPIMAPRTTTTPLEPTTQIKNKVKSSSKKRKKSKAKKEKVRQSSVTNNFFSDVPMVSNVGTLNFQDMKEEQDQDNPPNSSRLAMPKKCRKKKPKKDADDDQNEPDQPEGDTPIRELPKRKGSKRVGVLNDDVAGAAMTSDPSDDVKKNILDQLQSSIIQGVTQTNEQVDVDAENEQLASEDSPNDQHQNSSEQNDQSENQNESDDQKEDGSNENQNLNSDSTERDDNASASESPLASPTPDSEFINSLVNPEIDCLERQVLLKRAIPEEVGAVKLTIVRKKGGFARMSPKYYLYDENKTNFLLNAKKKVANKTSNYLISLDEGAFSKDSFSFIGKVRSNHAKNKYLIYDNGENVEKNKHATEDQGRCELGYVAYTKGKNKVPGMRELEYIVPNINKEGDPLEFKPATQSESITQKCTMEDISSMIFFETQTAYWNEEKEKYMMAYSDRVKEVSVKNFQLKYKTGREASADEDILLEFGRVNKTDFALTIKYPFSVMNAFGLVLSTFDL